MKFKIDWFYILTPVTVWIVLSLCASEVTALTGVCNKTYPINYILYSRLFCEIGEQNEPRN